MLQQLVSAWGGGKDERGDGQHQGRVPGGTGGAPGDVGGGGGSDGPRGGGAASGSGADRAVAMLQCALISVSMPVDVLALRILEALHHNAPHPQQPSQQQQHVAAQHG